jgi:hypothetical protein
LIEARESCDECGDDHAIYWLNDYGRLAVRCQRAVETLS